MALAASSQHMNVLPEHGRAATGFGWRAGDGRASHFAGTRTVNFDFG